MKRTGLRLTREVSLDVDWASFSEKLFKAVTQGFKAFHGDLKGGVDAIFALIGTAKSIKEDVHIGARGLELILLCFAWSFDAVRATGHLKEELARDAAKDAIDLLKRRVETGELEIPFDFFEQPTAAEPYQLLRDEFLRNRRAYRPSVTEDEAGLKARFDSSFRSAVWEVWAGRASVFEDLARALNSPAAKTADFERQWHAYRESLINEFHVAPVFGQEETRVSLGQLYVPLRCFWREIERSDERSSRYVESPLDEKQIYHVRSLPAELDAWIDNDDPNDWLRLIGGGPGSGKSTSARALAARLAEREDLRPIFIPLQRLKGEGRLRENINSYFRDRSGCPFQVGPIERKYVENGPRLVLIFDGLDEIARPGESADDIARDMIDWIRDLRSELTGETRANHRVLVTGRMPSFQAARRRVDRKGKEALEVLGFLPVGSKKVKIARPSAITWETTEGDDALNEVDQRKIWWTGYSSALGRPAEPPGALMDERLESLTAEPLLCYLLALSGYLEEDSEEAVTNRNKIFERLLYDVWKRGWGGGRAGSGKDLSKEDFDRLFETMALAAWHGGDQRVATLERFEKSLKVTRATEIYEKFESQQGGDVSNLAVNFYLRSAEKEARGFEFTHKSFGEYLAARALISVAIDVAKLSTQRMDVALADWLAAVADGDLTDELLEFLRDEARLLPSDVALSTLRSLEKVMGEVITHGFPAHDLRCETWRHAEERQRKAETLLMTLLHCVSMRVAIDSKEEARIRINWREEKMAFGNFLHRIRKSRGRPLPALSLFSYLEAPGAWLLAQDLLDSTFFAANLEGAWFFGAGLARANLERANLKDANFTYANLEDANLEGANLEGANLYHASLEDADLEGANLEGANLEGANLKGANLKGANLKGANLEGANLEGANLEGANLEGANLEGAKLKGAKLKDANLKGAKLDGKRPAGKKSASKKKKVAKKRKR